jgi:two-component system, LuxR family, response regulator FixJ
MLSSPTVVVVDDDDQVRESLAALIQSMSLDVECFSSGQDFLDNYSADRPGCIVLDLRLPQLSGLEIIEEMAARNIQSPVIMISGHGDIPAAVSAMKAGAVDFFEKPYRGTALMDSVRKAIARDASNREAQGHRRELLERYESLTDDEKDVLQLTVLGKPDKAIALKLDWSLRTIQLRRASVMRKLNAHSRADLIRLAQWLEQPALAQNNG